jgi:pimeloyl-[acyl-carrier protein] methyl ester esterase
MTNNSLGENWLLLRGLSREAGHWGEFPMLLQDSLSKTQVHTLDLSGTGRFYQQTSPNRIEPITAHVRQQALTEGLLKRPLVLLAYSLGGMVAWEWMKTYPEDINGAVLLNTSFASLSPFYQRLRWQSYYQFISLMLKSNLYQREAAIIKLVSNRHDNDGKTTAEWTNIQQLRPVSLENTLRQITAAANCRPNGQKPTQPVLLLSSQQDRLVAPACSTAIQKRWQLDLATHPWAGHDLSLDDPLWVVEKIKHWSERQHC